MHRGEGRSLGRSSGRGQKERVGAESASSIWRKLQTSAGDPAQTAAKEIEELVTGTDNAVDAAVCRAQGEERCRSADN